MSVATFLAWLPVLALPTAVVFLTPADWPRWGFMWLLAGTIAFGCKWLTWRTAPPKGAPLWKQFGYLLAWPGMDAPAFLFARNLRVPALFDWSFAVAKLALGIALVGVVYSRIPADF